ncbi:hypothetical protein AB3N59_01500 [Leptospira sp. WS92.C1]
MKKNKSSLFCLILLTAFIACKKESKNNNAQNLVLLTLLNSSSSLTPEQRSASASANGASAASNAVQADGSLTASNDIQQEQLLMASVFENGMDPVVARETAYQIAQLRSEKETNPVHLTATTINVTGSNTTTPGQYSYEFDGSVDGITFATTQTDISALVGGAPDSCLIEIPNPAGGSLQGTATFGSGSTLVYNGSGSGTSFNGESTLNTVVTFNNFGTYYTDYLTVIQFLKNPTDTPIAGTGCDVMKTAFQKAFSLMFKYAHFNSGAVTVEFKRAYSTTAGTSGLGTVDLSFSSKLNSPAGIAIQDYDGVTPLAEQTVTLENVVYAYNSNISVSGSYTPGSPIPPSITGGMSLSFSGKVNGTAIDQTFTFNF